MAKTIVDYTKEKPDGKTLMKCPVCGKTAQWRHYPNEPFDTYVHLKSLHGIFWNVDKSCEHTKGDK